MGAVHQVLGFHSLMFAEIWLRILLIRKRKELLAHFAQAPPDIHTVKNKKKFTYSHQDASISQLVEK